MATYAGGTAPAEWLGGRAAFISQTQKVVSRLADQLRNIQSDANFLGHSTTRFAQAIPSGIQNIERYSTDPIANQSRVKYHSCAVALTSAEVMASLNDKKVLILCPYGQPMSNKCYDTMLRDLDVKDAFKRFDLSRICSWPKI